MDSLMINWVLPLILFCVLAAVGIGIVAGADFLVRRIMEVCPINSFLFQITATLTLVIIVGVTIFKFINSGIN